MLDCKLLTRRRPLFIILQLVAPPASLYHPKPSIVSGTKHLHPVLSRCSIISHLFAISCHLQHVLYDLFVHIYDIFFYIDRSISALPQHDTMFNHTFNGLTYSDTSSSSSSSSPNSFPQSPVRPSSAQFFHQPPAPDVPSTFLPSYYPEGRYASHDRDLNITGNGIGYPSPNHSPATWEALSQAGPSSRHLLDGTNIIEPHPPHPRGKGVGREMRPPEYRISPASIASSLINKAATTSGSGSSFPMDPALQTLSNSGSGSGNPHGNESGGGGGGGGSGGGRYHPYSHPIQRSSPGTGTGGGGSGPSRSNTTIPDPSPNSNAYPGNMYTNIPLPERPDLEPWERMGAGVEITGEDYAQVSLSIFADGPRIKLTKKALEIYQHLLEAVPSMRAHNDYPPLAGGQRYEHLLGLASDGLSYLTGPPQTQIPPQAHPPSNPEPSSVPLNTSSSSNSNKRSAHNGNGDKKTPKCLGCGATETPEWRRGPMGPRTLCNACVSLHMLL